MLHQAGRVLAIALALMACGAGGCDCGSDLSKVGALAGRYAVGQDPFLLDPGALQAVPASGEVSLDFGQVELGRVARRYLFVRNDGEVALILSAIERDPAWPEAFFVACPNGGQFSDDCPGLAAGGIGVAAGADLVLEFRYAPAAELERSTWCDLVLNADDHPRLNVRLTGQGVARAVELCAADCVGDQADPDCQAAGQVCGPPLALALGELGAGQTRARTVRVVNTGGRLLQVGGVRLAGGDPGQFAWSSPDGALPGSLDPGAEAALEVSYQPASGGQHAADLIVATDTGDVAAQLTGSMTAPRACPDPVALDFGPVAVGQQAQRSFQLDSCGLAALDLERVALAPGTSPDFSLVDPPAPGQALAPGAWVEVTVAYAPGAHGSDSGGVDIFSSDPASDPVTGLTGTVALLGEGILRECRLQATPFGLNFGGVETGGQWELDLLVANQGTDDCTFERAEITANTAAGEFSLTAQPPADTPLAPGEIATLRVAYAPVDLGPDAGELTVYGDGQALPVQLAGEGLAEAACDLAIQPTRLQFGTVEPQHTRRLEIAVVNQGSAACQVSAPELLVGLLANGDFSLTASPAAPFSLARHGAVGDRAVLEVTFAPAVEGEHAGVVWLHTDDDPDVVAGAGTCARPGWPPEPPGAGDACISLSGQSAESDLEVVPGELGFGQVTVGCNSSERLITVYNTGTFTVSVESIGLADPADPDFELRQSPATPFSLGWGEQFTMTVRYHPQDDGRHANALVIETDDFDVPTFVVPLVGEGTHEAQQTDVFSQEEAAAADVLFVVDNSDSMAEEQAALADNFSAFIQWALSLAVDFQIGVITTMPDGEDWYQGDPPRDIVAGELVAAPGRPTILTRDTPDLVQAFAENVRVGTSMLAGTEAGLQAAHLALTPPKLTDANAGFLRDDARLYLIVVSDEDDQSEHGVDYYVDFLTALKGPRNTSRMALSAVVGPVPDGCDGAGGQALPGPRYVQAAQETGGILESICTPDWASALQNLGLDAFSGYRDFPLSRPAVPDTISATSDGLAVPEASCSGCADGWTYYPDANAVTFGDDVVPGLGAVIEISYTAACL